MTESPPGSRNIDGRNKRFFLRKQKLRYKRNRAALISKRESRSVLMLLSNFDQRHARSRFQAEAFIRLK